MLAKIAGNKPNWCNDRHKSRLQSWHILYTPLYFKSMKYVLNLDPAKKKNKFKCIVAFISLFHTHTHTHTLFISHTFHQDPVNSWMIYAHIDEMMQNQLHLFCKLDKISHVAWIPFVYDFQFHDTNCSHWLPWFGINNPVWFVQWRMVFIVVILVTSVFFIVVSIRAFTTIIIIILPFSFNSKQGTISPEKRMNRINRFSRFILCNFPYQSCLNLRSEPKTVSKMASKYLCANVSSSMRLLFSRAIKRPALQVQIKKMNDHVSTASKILQRMNDVCCKKFIRIWRCNCFGQKWSGSYFHCVPRWIM